MKSAADVGQGKVSRGFREVWLLSEAGSDLINVAKVQSRTFTLIRQIRSISASASLARLNQPTLLILLILHSLFTSGSC